MITKCHQGAIATSILSVLLMCALAISVKFGYLDHNIKTKCNLDDCIVTPNTCYSGKYVQRPFTCYNWCIYYSLSYNNITYNRNTCSGYSNSPSWWSQEMCNIDTVTCWYNYKNEHGIFQLDLVSLDPAGGVVPIVLITIALVGTLIATSVMWSCKKY